MVPDNRLFYPATLRNRDAIGDVMRRLGLTQGKILEIASGSGEHGVYLTEQFSELQWQPSDIEAEALASIDAWRGARPDLAIAAPRLIDTSAKNWADEIAPLGPFDMIFCANMIHIAPFAAAEGLLRHGAGILGPEGRLFFYGPFKRDGEMAESNRAFDRSLKARNPEWGVRDLTQEIVPLAQDHGFTLAHVEQMPANNLSVVFGKT